MKEVLKFYADWCTPCKILSRTLNSIEDISIPIKEIDIDQEIDLAAKYNIRGIPTMVMLEDGNEIKRVSGTISVEKVKEFLNG